MVVYRVSTDEEDIYINDEVLQNMELLFHMKNDLDIMVDDGKEEIDLGSISFNPTCFKIIVNTCADDETKMLSLFRSLNVLQLCEICNECDFLNCQKVLKLVCSVIQEIFACSSVEQIRDLFGLVDDFTPEEKLEIQQEQKIFNWTQT